MQPQAKGKGVRFTLAWTDPGVRQRLKFHTVHFAFHWTSTGDLSQWSSDAGYNTLLIISTKMKGGKKNHVKYQDTWLYKVNMKVKKNSKYSNDIISTAWLLGISKRKTTTTKKPNTKQTSKIIDSYLTQRFFKPGWMKMETKFNIKQQH